MGKLIKNTLAIVAILFIGFIIFILFETRDEINANLNTIEEHLENFYNRQKLAGFSVAVFNRDSVFYTKGFGYADVKQQIPYTTKSLQYVASVAKTTIGISLMKAVELKLFKLDDPINKHLPFDIANPIYPENNITIRHLATHTSSLDYNEKVVESLYVNESEKDLSMRPFMESYFVRKLYGDILFTKNKPGEHWNYSNIGAALAAYIVEYKSGMSYADFTHQYIFEPLEMEGTHWFEKHADSSRYSKYYESRVGPSLFEVDGVGVKLYPARDLITTVEDLTKYCQAVMKKNPSVLVADSYDELLKSQLLSSVKNQELDAHGLFWMIDRNQYGITYQLTGANGGDNCINTMMWFDPRTNLAYIFIGNTGGSEQNRGNHIWIYRALVSLGDEILMNDPNNTLLNKVGYKWHNLYNRVRALF